MSSFSKRNDMKKMFFAVSLAALLPLLFSCEKVNDDQNSFAEPRFVQYAGQLIPRGGEPSASLRSASAAPEFTYTYLEFTESGLYVIGQTSGGTTRYITGSYNTSDGKSFSLSGFGSVTVSGDSNPVEVTITPSGGSPVTFKAERKTATVKNVAYRTWKIEKTRATVNGFHAPASADFVGCNFDEIAKFLNDNGHKGDYLPSGSLNTISFTGVNTIVFGFSDSTADLGDCTLSGNDVNFVWKGETRLFEVENGKATIDYLDGKCILKVEAGLKGSTTSGSVTFVMSSVD